MIEGLIANDHLELSPDVVDALTTNETFFFRDRTPFELLRATVIPYLLDARQAERRISIWCNACSTGQEPYSIAMLMDELGLPMKNWKVDLQATDVSSAAVRAAREGLYNKFEVQRGLPASALLKYFNSDGAHWRVIERVRAAVRYSTFNLLNSFAGRGPHDIIFCRNVLIYFDHATRMDILARLKGALREDGFLILGSTETIMGAGAHWTCSSQSPLLFVRADGPHAKPGHS